MSRPRALRRKSRRDRCDHPKSSPRVGGRAEDDGAAWVVVDDWPEIPPVTRAEIDVIETWFADLLDEILSSRR
ncbi:hypothetical protein [Rhodoblastus sp.]|uniref:hypothetical protein n=1 Tax=Rhodoblastus sp. TaxID=1962975 RepID=UPI003F9AB368